MNDTHRVADALAGLDAAERGFLLGVLTIGGDRAAMTAVLEGEAGFACTNALLVLNEVSRAERAQVIAELGRDLLADLPPGFAEVHLDWVRAALERLPSGQLRAVAHDGPPVLRAAAAAVHVVRGESPTDAAEPALPAAWVRDLRRMLFRDIVPVAAPVAADPAVHQWRALLALDGGTRARLLEAIGVEVLGGSLLGAAVSVIDRAADYVGARLAPRLRARATGGPGSSPSRTNAGPATPRPEYAAPRPGDRSSPEAWPGMFIGMDATDRQWARKLVAATAVGQTVDETLERLGARAIGDAIARTRPDVDLVRALAQRLCVAAARELMAGAGL